MKINRPLSILALIGLLLYGGVLLLSRSAMQEPAGAAPSISRAAAARAAAEALEQVPGIAAVPSRPQLFVTYRTNKILSGYLQKEQLADLYEKQYGKRYPLDYYSVEIRDRASSLHYAVDLGMEDGRLLGWRDLNAVPVILTGREEETVQAFLRQKGYDPQRLARVQNATDPPGRVVYEDRSFSVGQSRLRLEIIVSGDRVAAFHAAFTVPESHVRWMKSQDTLAGRLTWLSTGLTALMAVSSAVYIIRRRREIRFSRGVGLALLTLVLYVVNNLNMYPAYKAVQGFGNSGTGTLLFLLFINFVTVLLSLTVYLYLAAGQQMWLGMGWNPWPAFRDGNFAGEVLRSMGRGYLISFFLLGLQQMLFLIAEKGFRVWSVNDPADSPLNMLNPALFPLMAWVAGISEEATYRLFGIALFKKWFRGTFPAVLLPSMIWALAHTQYPIYPVYTRFFEVTILGLVFGYMFLRYGLMTVIFAHASMDSILMGLSLQSMGGPGSLAPGLFYMALPALVGWLIHRLARKPPVPLHP